MLVSLNELISVKYACKCYNVCVSGVLNKSLRSQYYHKRSIIKPTLKSEAAVFARVG